MIINRFEAAGLKCIEVTPENAEGRDLPLFICLHGRGDWGESYVDLAGAISESDYRYILPTGPLALENALFEWFRLDSGDITQGAQAARATVTNLVKELLERFQTPAGRTVLGGFSQGGMMTFDTGLRYPEKLAGLVVLSGMLLADGPFNFMNPPDPAVYFARVRDGLKDVLAEVARRQTPVFIGHGAYDQVVPVVAGSSAAQLLKQAGVPVEYYEFPGQHEITLEELQKIKAFLQRVISE
jgi:phospholipase/carboxylesterase